MAQTCDEFETQLNDGSWTEGNNASGEEPGSQLIRFAGLSAAAWVSALVMQRRVAHRLDAWQIDESSGQGPLKPHPLGSGDLLDESDTESVRSVRKMPVCHRIESCAESLCESIGSHRRSLSIQSGFGRSPKLCLHKTIGTDPVEEIEEKQYKKEKMVDRGCSPLPPECFDSDIDSEERYGLACDLWHFRPTILPGMEAEFIKEKELYVKEQKSWMKEVETERTEPWKKNPFKVHKDMTGGEDEENIDTTWGMVKRILWGENQGISKLSAVKKC